MGKKTLHALFVVSLIILGFVLGIGVMVHYNEQEEMIMDETIVESRLSVSPEIQISEQTRNELLFGEAEPVFELRFDENGYPVLPQPDEVSMQGSSRTPIEEDKERAPNLSFRPPRTFFGSVAAIRGDTIVVVDKTDNTTVRSFSLNDATEILRVAKQGSIQSVSASRTNIQQESLVVVILEKNALTENKSTADRILIQNNL